jgi:hypothetical protein
MRFLVAQQIDVARALVKLDCEQPNSAALRRAVSTAYYALFQAFCENCAEQLVGWGKPWEVLTPTYRATDHGRAIQTLKDPVLASIANSSAIAVAFNEWQAARHWADYNPEPRPKYDARKNASPFTRRDAERLIGAAEEAIGFLNQLNEDERLRFATRLVAQNRK